MPQILVARYQVRSGVTDTRMHRAALMLRRLGIELLKVVRKNDRGHRRFGTGNPHGPIDSVTELWRSNDHLHEGRSDVFEQRGQVDFLLIAAAQGRAALLADYSYDRLVVQFGIVQTGQEMNCTGTGRRHAYRGLPSELGMSAGHE